MIPEMLPHIVTVIVSILTAAGVTYTAHLSHRSASRTSDAERIGQQWERMDKMQDEIDALRTEIDALRLERTQQTGLIRVHSCWDDMAVERLQATGAVVLPPPPLVVT